MRLEEALLAHTLLSDDLLLNPTIHNKGRRLHWSPGPFRMRHCTAFYILPVDLSASFSSSPWNGRRFYTAHSLCCHWAYQLLPAKVGRISPQCSSGAGRHLQWWKGLNNLTPGMANTCRSGTWQWSCIRFHWCSQQQQHSISAGPFRL